MAEWRSSSMQTNPTIRSLRWLFLAWMVLIYLEGLWSFHLFSLTKCLPDNSCSLVRFLSTVGENNLASLGTFTGLMLLFGTLVWIGQARLLPSRFLWPSFCLQGELQLLLGCIVLPLDW